VISQKQHGVIDVGKHANEIKKLLTDYDNDSAYSLAYHTLFATIRLDWERAGTKQHTVVLTSPASLNDPSTAAVNLALAAAQEGVPTTLIDADFAQPSVRNRFGLVDTPDSVISEANGLQFCKSFHPDLFLLVQKQASLSQTEIRRLYNAHYKDALASSQNYLAKESSRPSLVVVASPPVLRDAHAAFLGTLADQTLLLVASGQTTRSQAQRAQDQLARAQVRLSGTILLDSLET
jgi:tyrosine-protein kinase Etk/Wzc